MQRHFTNFEDLTLFSSNRNIMYAQVLYWVQYSVADEYWWQVNKPVGAHRNISALYS